MDQYSTMNASGVVDQHGSNFKDQYSAMNATGVVDQHGSNFKDQYSATGIDGQYGSNYTDQHSGTKVPSIVPYKYDFICRDSPMEIRNPRFWDIRCELTNDEKFEIKSWIDNINRFNAQAWWDKNTFDAICFSDASNEGFAGYNYLNRA